MKASAVDRLSTAILIIAYLSSCVVQTISVVVCPDGESECPSNYTCCLMINNKYGCCPLPKAVCCSDHTHCCPAGFKCNLSVGSCYQESGKQNTRKTIPAVLIKQSTLVKCNGTVACPDKSTCCKYPSGYLCCELPQAVCCQDGIHCCPSGWECLDIGECSKTKPVKPQSTFSITFARKLSNYKAVKCPDGRSECPDGNTCCKLASGQYGCCPLPKAVCCSDHIHCCPNGYTCDVSSGTCNRGLSSIPFVKKLPSRPVKKDVGNVICPGGATECPDGNTCCKLASGQYGCCPLPNAVCCSDHIHCCPNGYTCDVSSSTCNRGLSSIPFVKKLPSRPSVRNDVGNVICPGGAAECPDGSTCCKLASGQYGCCPLPNAVCCSDHIHCCPNGYTCDVSSGKCNRGLSSIPFVKKLPSRPVKKDVGNVICPGGAAECPDGNTCCKLASGQYGCCPLPKAVCCSDHIHCCPNGYTCDVSSGTCNSSFNGFAAIPFVKIFPEVESISFNSDVDLKRKHAVKNINCPDGSQCLDYETCCLLSTGGYGCCPLPNAVCCPDHEHCCPCGYICDSSSRMCYASAKTVPMIPHSASSRSQKLDGVVDCPDGSECNNGETCCESESGKYSCCPLPSAVCCSDKKHCCPYGFTCDVEKQKCLRGNSVIPMLTKRISKKAVTFQSLPVTVPKTPTVTDDVIRFVPRIHRKGQCHCGLYKTCCVGSGGQQHCCPLPNASCCADGLHCCPEGFTCDSKGCIQN